MRPAHIPEANWLDSKSANWSASFILKTPSHRYPESCLTRVRGFVAQPRRIQINHPSWYSIVGKCQSSPHRCGSTACISHQVLLRASWGGTRGRLLEVHPENKCLPDLSPSLGWQVCERLVSALSNWLGQDWSPSTQRKVTTQRLPSPLEYILVNISMSKQPRSSVGKKYVFWGVGRQTDK